MIDSTKPKRGPAVAPLSGAAELRAALTVNMPVYEREGRRLGSVAAVQFDASTGSLAGIAVRHGFLGYKHACIPTADLLRVSQGTVVLMHSKAAFDRLPLCDPPPARILSANLTWQR